MIKFPKPSSKLEDALLIQPTSKHGRIFLGKGKTVHMYFKWFPTYLHNPAKDRGVIHGAAVPSSMSELILAFFDACLRALSNVLHVVLIQVAEFLLSLRKSCQLAAERLCSYDIYF